MYRRLIRVGTLVLVLGLMSVVPQAQGSFVTTLSAAEAEPGAWRNLLIDPETGKPHCHEKDDDCHT